MNEKKQTAVQWLETEMKNRYAIASTHECIELFKQALAMEQNEMIRFASAYGYACGFNGVEENIVSAIECWNNTYRNEP